MLLNSTYTVRVRIDYYYACTCWLFLLARPAAAAAAAAAAEQHYPSDLCRGTVDDYSMLAYDMLRKPSSWHTLAKKDMQESRLASWLLSLAAPWMSSAPA